MANFLKMLKTGEGLITQELVLRRATHQDSDDILLWRNDPYTCSMCGTRDRVSGDRHQAWFNQILVDPHVSIYIGLCLEEKLGVCRFNFDPEKNTSEVSINLNPRMRGLGLSKKFLLLSMDCYQVEHNVTLVARIRKENLASIKLFEGCKFLRQGGEHDGVMFFENSFD